jgi:hypothetical protein
MLYPSTWVMSSFTKASARLYKKMQSEQAKCTLIIPIWESAPFWPLSIEADGKFKSFIIKDIANLVRNWKLRHFR